MAHGKGIETYADGTIRHDGQWVDDEVSNTWIRCAVDVHLAG